jgi:hypothetical protein
MSAETNTRTSPSLRAADQMPLHLATRVRETHRRDLVRIEGANPAVQSLMPIALSLARIAAAEDLI